MSWRHFKLVFKVKFIHYYKNYNLSMTYSIKNIKYNIINQPNDNDIYRV